MITRRIEPWGKWWTISFWLSTKYLASKGKALLIQEEKLSLKKNMKNKQHWLETFYMCKNLYICPNAFYYILCCSNISKTVGFEITLLAFRCLAPSLISGQFLNIYELQLTHLQIEVIILGWNVKWSFL